jgi:FlaG/FlaF family flagellin (archaellin)
MIIMLIIAGLIIFNTMLNSIAERKREIHIYTSLGLAPMHVGILFVAEALTYGLMGSIFGYVVGQGVATGLSELGWLGGITLNYSGTQAIATMLMVLVVVVLSALVPAFMAGKIAAPSEDMKWRVPDPVDDTIRDSLPFTVTRETANGVMMFLHDYMNAHAEGSIGHFSTDNLRTFSKTTDQGVELLGIDATVWLAPYDLGVRQDVTITIRPTDEENVLEIDVELRRGAGQVRSWWKLNRVFLGDLRRQLLGWRKLKTGRVLEYIAEGAEMLGRSGGSLADLPLPPGIAPQT